MGFFSWNCKGCNESIKAPYSIPESITWQNDAVCLLENGSIMLGRYDGYGSLDSGFEVQWEDAIEWWHQQCWEKADKPKFTGASTHADDQGFFYNDPEGN